MSRTAHTIRIGRQAAFALPSAIFLMVILAALAIFLVTVSTHQQAGHAADIQGVRAYQAARAGLEWGTYRFLSSGSPPVCPAAANFSPGGALAAFTVSVTCASVAPAPDEAGNSVYLAQIVANACNQPTAGGACPNNAPGANYVEREISAVVSQ